MLVPAYINTNQFGIPALRSLSVSVTANDVRFDFNNHRNVGRAFRGLIIINLAQAIPDEASSELPIVFTSDGGNAINLTTYNGNNVDVDDIQGTGIYLVWYESSTNTLQLIQRTDD